MELEIHILLSYSVFKAILLLLSGKLLNTLRGRTLHFVHKSHWVNIFPKLIFLVVLFIFVYIYIDLTLIYWEATGNMTQDSVQKIYIWLLSGLEVYTI